MNEIDQMPPKSYWIDFQWGVQSKNELLFNSKLTVEDMQVVHEIHNLKVLEYIMFFH